MLSYVYNSTPEILPSSFRKPFSGTTLSTEAGLDTDEEEEQQPSKSTEDEEHSKHTTEEETPKPAVFLDPVKIVPSQNRSPLKVMFLSANAGGGHRASAASLEAQFQNHFPGSECLTLELEQIMNTWPYSQIANSYKGLTSNPSLWRMIYHISNARPVETVMDWHSTTFCENIFFDLLEHHNPDLVVSVHPNLNLVPMRAAQRYSQRVGRKVPFFTVVTDLGSGHCGWFQKEVDRLYLASDKIRELALRRKRTPEDRIQLTGLPIRHEFAVIAEQMGDRLSSEGRHFREKVKRGLGLDVGKPMILVMGGGEGVGSLSQIVSEIYIALTKKVVDCTLCVVCAKNAALKASFEATDWPKILEGREKSEQPSLVATKVQTLRKSIRAYRGKLVEEPPSEAPQRGNVTIVPLGFVTKMAQYMAAADLLITKAGPGTIAEAAALGLPIMLTSFLPGQEAGNVDVVLEQGFGSFSDKPLEIAETVATWMKLPSFLDWMSRKAKGAGHPDAAAEIVLDIGSRTHAWLEHDNYPGGCNMHDNNTNNAKEEGEQEPLSSSPQQPEAENKEKDDDGENNNAQEEELKEGSTHPNQQQEEEKKE